MSTSAVASHRWRWLEFFHWSTLAQRSSTSALTDSRQSERNQLSWPVWHSHRALS